MSSQTSIERAMEKNHPTSNLPSQDSSTEIGTPLGGGMAPPNHPNGPFPSFYEEPGLDIGAMLSAMWAYRGLAFTLILLFATALVVGNEKIFPDKYEAIATVRVKTSGIDSIDNRDVSILPGEVLSSQVLGQVVKDLELTKRDKVPLIETLLVRFGIPVKDNTSPSGAIHWMKTSVNVHEERTGNVTQSFSVSLIDKDPDLAADVVNSIVKHYLALHHEFDVLDSREAVAFLQPQMEAAEEAYKTATQALADYQSENADYLIPTETIENNIARFQQEHAEAETRIAQIIEVNKRLGELDKLVPTFVDTATNVDTTSLDGQLRHLQGQLALAKTRYASSHPDISGLTLQIRGLKTAIKQNPEIAVGQQVNPDYLRIHQLIDENEAERTVLERRLPAISVDIERMSEYLKHVKVAQTGLLAYQSDWDKTYNDHQRIRNQYLSVKTTADAQTGDIGHDMTVLDYANVPTIPISAARQKLMIVGVIAAVALGVGIIFLRAMLLGWKVPENKKQLSTFSAIALNMIGIVWAAAIVGYIVITPYI